MAEDGIAHEAAIRHKKRSRTLGVAMGTDERMEQASGEENTSVLSAKCSNVSTRTYRESKYLRLVQFLYKKSF